MDCFGGPRHCMVNYGRGVDDSFLGGSGCRMVQARSGSARITKEINDLLAERQVD